MIVVMDFMMVEQGKFALNMPKGADILSVGFTQDGRPCIWARCDSDAELEKRTLYVARTRVRADEIKDAKFIGSVSGIGYGIHVFELGGAE